MGQKQESRYSQRGVSATKEAVHEATKNLDKGLYPNAFCNIHPDLLGGSKKYCNIQHSDGTGTKTALAYAYWKATGDLRVWKGVVQDAIAMNLDDLLCAGVGDRDAILLDMTIGRNKNLIPDEVVAELIKAAHEIVEALRGFGMNIHYTGGETADVGDLVRTVTIDFTVTTRMRRKNVITNDIRPGDIVVGVSSDGYVGSQERQINDGWRYNSGMRSNGLTAARHDLFKDIGFHYPETFDPHMGSDLVYSGNNYLLDKEIQCSDDGESINLDQEFGLDLGLFVLSPTRIYAPIFHQMVKRLSPRIHGIVHCSGGGQTKALNFLEDDVCVHKDRLFDTPMLFRFIQKESGTPWKEMYEVFNMGHGIEFYVPDERVAEKIIAQAQSWGVDAKIVGRCVESDKPSVMIENSYGTFEYGK